MPGNDRHKNPISQNMAVAELFQRFGPGAPGSNR